MNSQLKEMRGTVDNSSRTMMNQVRSFTQETTELKKDLKHIQEKIGDISSFQEIFKSPKLRGLWGEASLQHILTEFFPQELWQMQYSFLSGEKVDAILKLPNKKLLPIDSKFSSDNFERMIRAQNEEEKERYGKIFLQDVKKRIDEIAGKYILPSEGTVDFALMYIPAEAIYYEIMFHLREQDIPSYARKKKVILTSPNTIYLTLRTIDHWFRDTQISRKTQEILKRLGRIYQDAGKLSQTFKRLGIHLKNASSSYEDSEKRVSLLTGRVERLMDTKKPEQLE
ncbi:MAG: DNA recombination protein RmuC [Candidatus Pacebacteria bacterium]|nr:DNA recombination protein RmuC [Candidatus Paceibacterota bacterium]